MVRIDSRPGKAPVGTPEAPMEVSRDRRPSTLVAVVGVLIALLVAGGVVLALVVDDGAAAPDAPAQQAGIAGAEMTDAEMSVRLHVGAAREARLATASRLTDAERSVRQHLDADREAGLATASRLTDAEMSVRLHLDAAREARLATASRLTDAERSVRLHLDADRELRAGSGGSRWWPSILQACMLVRRRLPG